mgnify:CR=1 FL=1
MTEPVAGALAVEKVHITPSKVQVTPLEVQQTATQQYRHPANYRESAANPS